jgi:death-on-curing protein
LQSDTVGHMRRLDLAGFLLIAEAVTGIDADALARMPGVPAAESALAAPFAGYGAVEIHRGLACKGAVLCSRLVRNHPLPDGNKRVALLCMIELIRRNGGEWAPVADVDERAAMVDALAAREVTEEDFVRWVERQVRA